jgi:shikimate kinase
MLLVLVGPPGSGKTSVGLVLADRLGATFRDTDHDVEVASGRPVSDIFVESGESTFRALEKAAVTKALAEHDGVLALGGGAVLDAATRQLLSSHRVVYLDVGLAEAMRRLEMNRSRPLLLGNVRTQWQALADARRPFYEEVADQVIATDAVTPDQIAEQIADYWQERP